MKLIKNIAIIFSATALFSCGGEKNTEATENSGKDSVTTKADSTHTETSIFYNVPSATETFTLLKMYGGSFDKSLLNPADNISKYASSSAKAINLGVYSTDLSLCFMYKQNQDVNTYIKNVSELTNQLGIDGSYGQEVIKRLKSNENNIDSLNQIIADASVNADLYLKENQRNNLVVLTAAGAWLESTYIISNIANKTQKADLISLVADQKVTIKSILKMLEQNSSDADVQNITNDLKEIAALLEVSEAKTLEAKTSASSETMTIGNNKINTLTKDQLKAIVEKTQAIRNKITN